MENNFKSGLDVIYLTSCALNGIRPCAEAVSTMDLEAVYEQAKRHKLQVMTYMALDKVAEDFKNKMPQWYIDYTRVMKQVFLFAIEREKLQKFLEAEKIWYMPLKGILIQDLYPKLGMRQMVDNDYLMDPDGRERIKNYFENLGYKTFSYGKEGHDVYHKPPEGNFEMHVSLYHEAVEKSFTEYYADVFSRLYRVGDSYQYRFTTEDLYIYVTSHAYRHYAVTGGTGIRTLIDNCVFWRKYGSALDRKYLDKELSKLAILDFETKMRELSTKIFSAENCRPDYCDKMLSDKEKEFLDFFIGSGCFGTNSNYAVQSLGRIAGDGEITSKTKFKYILKRLFPSGPVLRANFPFFYKHKLLLPFFWIYRIFSKLFAKFGNIVKELIFIIKQK